MRSDAATAIIEAGPFGCGEVVVDALQRLTAVGTTANALDALFVHSILDALCELHLVWPIQPNHVRQLGRKQSSIGSIHLPMIHVHNLCFDVRACGLLHLRRVHPECDVLLHKLVDRNHFGCE